MSVAIVGNPAVESSGWTPSPLFAEPVLAKPQVESSEMLNPASVIAPEAICAKRGRWKHAACQDGVLEARGAKIIDTARAHPQPKPRRLPEKVCDDQRGAYVVENPPAAIAAVSLDGAPSDGQHSAIKNATATALTHQLLIRRSSLPSAGGHPDQGETMSD
jgi:hypothetical protein